MLHYNVFKKHLNNLIAQALAVANDNDNDNDYMAVLIDFGSCICAELQYHNRDKFKGGKRLLKLIASYRLKE